MTAPVWPAVDRRGVLGQSGLSVIDVRFIVERAHYRPGGVLWVREGGLETVPELAQQRSEKLRREGWRVRVRPIVL